MQSKKLDAVLFDLDGTIADTAADLHFACSTVLQNYQQKPIALSEFRNYISFGTQAMICHSFGIDINHPEYAEIKRQCIQCYQQHLVTQTQLYPGILQVLDYLDAQRIPWGIVTGKPTSLAVPILEHFGLFSRSHCLVGGDTIIPGKPDPAPLLHACALIACRPQYTIYVGDAENDIIAAHAAAMLGIGVTYGYHTTTSHPQDWQADFIVNTPLELLSVL